METANPVRVVPSGKVYRQMFDAEVQLVQKLEARSAPPHGNRTQDGSAEAGAEGAGEHQGIPTVHLSRDQTVSSGMLTERQKTWTQGFPNEVDLENPILYKYFIEESLNRVEPEMLDASQEVRGLPDVLVPAKTGSDIIDRIAQSRQHRHESTVEDLHHDLGAVSMEVEPMIIAESEQLIGKLEEDDVEIQAVMNRVQEQQELMRYTLEDLQQLWEEAAAHSEQRQQWIEALDKTLAKLEENRMVKIREIFQSYACTLEKIAHLMPPDLARLLDKESQLINQAVLSNRRAYADLHCRLMMNDIERDKRLHIQWTSRLDDWKRLHTELAVRTFRETMNSPAILDPPGARTVLQQMEIDQRSLNDRRIELVNSLTEFKPPASTKTSVYKWNQQISEISKEIDQLNQDYFNRLYAEYEKVCQTCLQKVSEIKSDLIARGICTEERAQVVINEQCLPLVGERQTRFERTLEQMDKALEEHNSHVLTELRSLFKFCQGAAHVWDVHEIGLARQERQLQEKLDTCRHGHDNENQDKEANLDIVMDRMRQDATEDSLRDNLQKVMQMLDTIKMGYYDFHQKQIDIVATYPDMVRQELSNYDATVCRFFTVDRKNPEGEGDNKDDKGEGDDAEKSSKKSPRKKRSKTSSSIKSSSAEEEKLPSDINESKTATSPLPLAVSEVLSTAKGTTFFVLTVAGEHGIPADDAKGQTEPRRSTDAAFLTEAESKKPDYILNVDVADDFILQIKKTIRLNYLDHMESWSEQAIDRSKSVVAAKGEELNSELDLRMHLHKPRSRRAELDVHNVRAAELVMHGERVTRHCKGVNQALTDLKTKFNEMTQQHNELADKFRDDIEALEVVFINATKSAKLVALSNQLQLEQDRYMNVIRTSLRQFRQSLDDTLQMLRESNARFIKSFKVFSDGGNFCPEEIDEYRKRLEKMAQKIDSAEGFIMADLEGMESKRLEQATKIAAEFEDRFKHHMIDLLFMEKIARWLTNTQVKIKAEVAESNTQAQHLVQSLRDLERKTDACQRPNLDKETVTPTQLNECLKSLFESFHDRSHYLHCVKDDKGAVRPPSAQTLQGNPALGVRVGFTSDAMPPVSRPGKQPTEDPSVSVIKNILKTQKSRLRFGADADLDAEVTQAPQGHPGMREVHAAPNNIDPRDHSKSRSRPPTQDDTRSKRSSRASNSNAAETPKRTQSGPRNCSPSIMARRQLTRTSTIGSKGQKYDKKYLVFGEKEELGEDTHFLGKIRRLLREALDGLLSAAELYYRQKGGRLVTRPQALQETFEQCADIVVAKLQSYFTQADEYHNQCLQELRSQLSQLEELVSHIPGCVIRELLHEATQQETSERAQLDKEFTTKQKEWDSLKLSHQNLLRPTLGHPQQATTLEELQGREQERHDLYLEGVQQQTVQLQDLAMSQGKAFVERLARASEQQLLQFDSLLTIDDVEKGRVPAVKYPTSELLRRKNTGKPLEDREEKENQTRGKTTWPGLSKSELIIPEELKVVKEPPKKEGRSVTPKAPRSAATTAQVTTGKTTQGHNATLEARDLAYKEYKSHFEETLRSIEAGRQKQLVAEQRWTENWHSSVEKVKELYNPTVQKVTEVEFAPTSTEA